MESPLNLVEPNCWLEFLPEAITVVGNVRWTLSILWCKVNLCTVKSPLTVPSGSGIIVKGPPYAGTGQSLLRFDDTGLNGNLASVQLLTWSLPQCYVVAMTWPHLGALYVHTKTRRCGDWNKNPWLLWESKYCQSLCMSGVVGEVRSQVLVFCRLGRFAFTQS